MAINRLAVSNPGATTDTLLHTATRNALVSVIATNTTTASVKTRIWVVPTGQDATPANWAYLSYDSDITGTNSLETFRFPIETGDKVYVRSNVSGISYSLNAVYEVVGNSYIFAQTGEPNAPTVGDIWVDTDNVANELNTNDYLLKADASAPSGYLLKTDAASTYVELAGDTMTGMLTAPKIELTDTTDVSLSSTGNPIQIGPITGANLVIDSNELQGRNNGAAATLFLNNNGGNVSVGAGGTTSTGAIRADSGGADGGLIMRPWTGGSSWTSLATNGMTGEEYILISQGARTLLGAGGGDIEIRPGTNSIANQLTVSSTGAHELSGAVLKGSVGGQGNTTSGANLTVTHGLGVTPSSVVATVRSNTYTSTNNTNIFVGNIGSTTFTVFANNGASGATSAAFSWIAVA